jgi:hypothetical protein
MELADISSADHSGRSSIPVEGNSTPAATGMASTLSNPSAGLLKRQSDRGVDGSPYAPAVRALLEDGPLQGTSIEVDAVEGRPPKTIDVPNEEGGTYRYGLAEWTQEGMAAAYSFLYAV